MILSKACALTSLLLLQTAVCLAEDWQKNADYQRHSKPAASGPVYKGWQSGQAVTHLRRVQYVPTNENRQSASSTNPWKPNSFSSLKLSPGQLRPWGNVPAQKARPEKGMRYYDEQFKRWSKQLDADYKRSMFSSGGNYPGATGLARPFGAYPFTAYPGLISPYNNYGGYPGTVYPYNNYYPDNRSGLPGFMRRFMPW